MVMKQIEIYIVGEPGSGKSQIREHLLAWYNSAAARGDLKVHTVQEAPKFKLVNKDDVS
jgi:type IV secretory pathway ATPase VirB11/archaellum biosynthesis ATPase